MELIGIKHSIGVVSISFDDSWKVFNSKKCFEMQDEIDTISDIIWVSSNPTNNNEFVASSFGGGLLLFENNELVEYSFS